MNAGDRADAALNRLCKWRLILSGRLLGTRPKTDPEAQGVRDLFEKLLILRAEVTALTGVLIERGLVGQDGLCLAVAEEADLLSAAYEKTFPGMRATDDGIYIYDTALAAETMKGWKP